MKVYRFEVNLAFKGDDTTEDAVKMSLEDAIIDKLGPDSAAIFEVNSVQSAPENLFIGSEVQLNNNEEKDNKYGFIYPESATVSTQEEVASITCKTCW